MPTFVLRITAHLPSPLTERQRRSLDRWAIANPEYRSWSETADDAPGAVLTEIHHVTKASRELASAAVMSYLDEDVAEYRLPRPTEVHVKATDPPPLPRLGPPSPSDIADDLRRGAKRLRAAAATYGIALDGTLGSLRQLEVMLREHWTKSKRGKIAPQWGAAYTWIVGYLFIALEERGGDLFVPYDERGVAVDMPDGTRIWIEQLVKERFGTGHGADLEAALEHVETTQP